MYRVYRNPKAIAENQSETFTGENRDYSANKNSDKSVLCTVSSESSMFAYCLSISFTRVYKLELAWNKLLRVIIEIIAQTKVPTSLCYAQSHPSLRCGHIAWSLVLRGYISLKIAWNKLSRVRIEIMTQTKTSTSLCYAQSHPSLRCLHITCR